MNIQDTAEYLIERLKKRGIAILRYDAISTKSVYLKLDYGVPGSIRISDHKGLKYLHYTFNVEVWRKNIDVSLDNRGSFRFYYPSTPEALDQLITKAMERVNERKEKYGDEKYAEYMRKNQQKGLGGDKTYTFWHKARLV